MARKILNQNYASPRLDTIRMVEEVLRNMNNSVISLVEIKERLPKQVNHYTLKIILEYLEESGKIYCGMKGITWVFNDNPFLKKQISEGIKHWIIIFYLFLFLPILFYRDLLKNP